MERELNCAQYCAKKICNNLGAEWSNKENYLLSLMGEGVGCGSICGGIIGAFAVMGKVFEDKCFDEMKYEILIGFVDKFGTVECAGLEKYYGNECKEIKEFICAKTVEIIKKRNK